ncbi:MAG TPA: hypothetical protein DHV62_08065 [Elusimicrobia bacterium]|nr:hypothetical protein [Elusimicrobiota bacterium]
MDYFYKSNHQSWGQQQGMRYRRKYSKQVSQYKLALENFSHQNTLKSFAGEQAIKNILEKIGIMFKYQPYFYRKNHKYIADFVFEHPYYLVIEADGLQHNTPQARQYDKKRSFIFGLNGYETLRLKNSDILDNPNEIKQKIIDLLDKRKFWNSGCRARSAFRSGQIKEIKPIKPIICPVEQASTAGIKQ